MCFKDRARKGVQNLRKQKREQEGRVQVVDPDEKKLKGLKALHKKNPKKWFSLREARA